MDLRTKKILRVVCKVILTVVGVFLLGILGYVMYMSISNTPSDIRVTNLTDSSFTVSWVTERDTKGFVYYKEKGFVWPGKGYDDRDWGVAQLDCDTSYTDGVDCKVEEYGKYYVHHVTVRGLDEEKGYSFFVSDGTWLWKGDSVTTLSSLESVGEPSPVFGKVVTDTGDVSNDSIVYVQFTDTSDHITSLYYSSVTNSSGGWYVDASTVRTEDGSVLDLELSNDSFKANAIYKNNYGSGVYDWVLGFFDMAYPDIEVEQNAEISNENVLGTCTCTSISGCSAAMLPSCGSTLGYGNVAEALSNNGVVSLSTLEEMGLCSNAVSCAGNLSAITNHGMSAVEIDSDYDNSIDPGVEISLNYSGGSVDWNIGSTGECTPGECYESTDGQYQRCNSSGTWGDLENGNCSSSTEEEPASLGVGDYVVQEDAQGDLYVEINGERISTDLLIGVSTNLSVGSRISTINVPWNYIYRAPSDGTATTFVVDNEEHLNWSNNTISFEGDGCTYNITRLQSGSSAYIYSIERSGGGSCTMEETDLSLDEVVDILVENTSEDDFLTSQFTYLPSDAYSTDGERAFTITESYENNSSEDGIVVEPETLNNGGTDICTEATCMCTYSGGISTYVTAGYECPEQYYNLDSSSDECRISNGGSNSVCPCFGGCVSDYGDGQDRYVAFGGTYYNAGLTNEYNHQESDSSEYRKDIFLQTDDEDGVRCNDPQGCDCYRYTADSSAGESTHVSCTDITSQEECNDTNYQIVEYGQTCVASLFDNPSSQVNESEKSLYASVLGTSDSSYFLLPEYGFYTLQVNGIELSQKISKEDNTVYLFYVEGNGIDGYQVPNDIDHPQSDEDKVIESNALEITYTKVSEQKNINLLKGLNMVSFNSIPAISDTENTTAKDFILWLRGRGFDITNITYFSNGRWDGGVYCEGTEETSCSGNDFVLVPGKGYMVRTNEDISTSYPGYSLTSSVPISLSAGWNLVGVNGYTQTFTARTLIDSVNTMSDTVSDNVTGWTSSKGKYEGFQYSDNTEYGLDFPISAVNGYFVRVKSIGECNTRIWYYGSDRNGECIEN